MRKPGGNDKPSGGSQRPGIQTRHIPGDRPEDPPIEKNGAETNVLPLKENG